MNDNWVTADLKAMAESLRASIRQFGGFNPDQVRKAGVIGEEALRHWVLRALETGPKTGQEIIEWISGESRQKPTAGKLYPLLENLSDLGLISAEFKKDRKSYSLTEAGAKAVAESSAVEPEPANDDADSQSWFTPNWIDLRGALPKAGRRLAKVSVELAQRGTKEQQDRAVEVLEEATRAIHEILAEK